MRPSPRSTLFPYTTLFRSFQMIADSPSVSVPKKVAYLRRLAKGSIRVFGRVTRPLESVISTEAERVDRKSTRLNSSHSSTSYAVFCLKKNRYYHVVSPFTH